MPRVFKITVAGKCPSHSHSHITARKHALVDDERVLAGEAVGVHA